MTTSLYFSLIFILLTGCSGISLLTPGDRASLYRDSFLAKIEHTKQLYAQGEREEALKLLRAMREEELRPTERALKRNLIGVIYFSMDNYEQAIFHFDLALSSSRLDDELTSQIHLNMASTYYLADQLDRAFNALERSDYQKLTPEEAAKHHRLHYTLAKALERNRDASIALIRYFAKAETISEMRNDPLYHELTQYFFRLSRREKLRVIESFENDQNLAAGYMAYLEAERAYYRGNRQEAIDMLSWVERRFPDQVEIGQIVQAFLFRLENFTQMNQYSIGVVLPLSGERRDIGQRTLRGIDSALREIELSGGPNYQLFIADSEGSGGVGAHRVDELIQRENVSIIIGGLFSNEAEKQYREARRRGVFFISLSQLVSSKNEKNHLLLEIPGSIESQLRRVFSPDMIERFGNRGAIIYPDTHFGHTYINEFWRMANLNEKVEVSGVVSYQANINDFRDPMSHLLGIKFDRNRQEEKELYQEIHALENRRGVRRVQTLKPQTDFDWIFIPAAPMEALQIIPNVNYFDARHLSVIGGPSWRSRTLLRESSRLGELFFIADDIRAVDKGFVASFYETYNVRPRLVELRGRDAMEVAHELLGQREFEDRNHFDLHVRETELLSGMTGEWKLEDEVWIKEMTPLSMRRGEINPIFIQDQDLLEVDGDSSFDIDETSQESLEDLNP